MKTSQVIDKNLWLVHLVQLKKLFLKLSAYVELYLKQDWSLLPVPDFKLVAKSDEITSHLNFMVAAVLLTATHSGKNLEYEKILEFLIPSSLRKEIQLIQDAFMIALEPKSPKSFPNSPRKTSLVLANNSNISSITPKVLFPSNLSSTTSLEFESITSLTIEKTIDEFQEFDIKLQEIYDSPAEKDDHPLQVVEFINCSITNINVPSGSNPDTSSDTSDTNLYNSDLIGLQNEVKLLEIKLSEMDKLLQKSKDSENSQVQTIQNLSETQLKLSEAFEELRELKEKQEYEKIERNSFMAAFDHERQILDDHLEHLKKENNENRDKIEALSNENKNLRESVNEKDEQIRYVQTTQFEKFAETEEILKTELNQSILDNSKLVKALKKARDHIINQDSLIKELKETLQTSELRNSELLTSKDVELQFLRESFETERIAMNRVLVDLGTKIQKSNL